MTEKHKPYIQPGEIEDLERGGPVPAAADTLPKEIDEFADFEVNGVPQGNYDLGYPEETHSAHESPVSAAETVRSKPGAASAAAAVEKTDLHAKKTARHDEAVAAARAKVAAARGEQQDAKPKLTTKQLSFGMKYAAKLQSENPDMTPQEAQILAFRETVRHFNLDAGKEAPQRPLPEPTPAPEPSARPPEPVPAPEPAPAPEPVPAPTPTAKPAQPAGSASSPMDDTPTGPIAMDDTPTGPIAMDDIKKANAERLKQDIAEIDTLSPAAITQPDIINSPRYRSLHPDAKEHFKVRRSQVWLEEAKLHPHSYMNFMERDLKSAPEHRLMKDEHIRDFVDHMYAKHVGEKGSGVQVDDVFLDRLADMSTTARKNIDNPPMTFTGPAIEESWVAELSSDDLAKIVKDPQDSSLYPPALKAQLRRAHAIHLSPRGRRAVDERFAVEFANKIIADRDVSRHKYPTNANLIPDATVVQFVDYARQNNLFSEKEQQLMERYKEASLRRLRQSERNPHEPPKLGVPPEASADNPELYETPVLRSVDSRAQRIAATNPEEYASLIERQNAMGGLANDVLKNLLSDAEGRGDRLQVQEVAKLFLDGMTSAQAEEALHLVAQMMHLPGLNEHQKSVLGFMNVRIGRAWKTTIPAEGPANKQPAITETGQMVFEYLHRRGREINGRYTDLGAFKWLDNKTYRNREDIDLVREFAFDVDALRQFANTPLKNFSKKAKKEAQKLLVEALDIEAAEAERQAAEVAERRAAEGVTAGESPPPYFDTPAGPAIMLRNWQMGERKRYDALINRPGLSREERKGFQKDYKLWVKHMDKQWNEAFREMLDRNEVKGNLEVLQAIDAWATQLKKATGYKVMDRKTRSAFTNHILWARQHKTPPAKYVQQLADEQRRRMLGELPDLSRRVI